ncbi:MAG: molecular chaperone DnaJ [Treponema sp.]|nr:MAG: molecular chaperone DnaJ [Treponema sp.]
MTDDYYDTIGAFLEANLSSEEDPFAKYETPRRTKYRQTRQRIERRPPPDIPDEDRRVVVPKALVEDFAVLNLLPGEALSLCKKSWKRLLKKYHPDTGSFEISEAEAAGIVRRINKSFRKIEHWYETGKILNDKEIK